MKNARRAANRARSLSRPTAMDKDESLSYRQPASNGERHYSYGSPGSVGAAKVPGTVMGAGELPAHGPGPAARRYAQRDPGETPMAQAPVSL